MWYQFSVVDLLLTSGTFGNKTSCHLKTCVARRQTWVKSGQKNCSEIKQIQQIQQWSINKHRDNIIGLGCSIKCVHCANRRHGQDSFIIFHDFISLGLRGIIHPLISYILDSLTDCYVEKIQERRLPHSLSLAWPCLCVCVCETVGMCVLKVTCQAKFNIFSFTGRCFCKWRQKLWFQTEEKADLGFGGQGMPVCVCVCAYWWFEQPTLLT